MPERDRELLVAASDDGGTAGVYRDREGVWLTYPLDGGGGAGLLEGYRPLCMGLGGTGLVVGGLLPPGASRAVVVDAVGKPVPATCGQGAWVAMVVHGDPFPEPPVRYESENGTIVRPPLPAGWAVEPVTDARDACPACGAVNWERVTPTDDSRGTHSGPSGDVEPAPVIVCARCGHEEGEGVWIASESDRTAAALPPEAARWLGVESRDRGQLLRTLDFPVFALAASRPRGAVSGWGRDGDGLSSVTVRPSPPGPAGPGRVRAPATSTRSAGPPPRPPPLRRARWS